MIGDCKVAVVIPCYNVGEYVADVLKDVPQFVDLIIAVNDASVDATLAVLTAAKDPRLTIVSLDENRGVGGGMVAGFAAALDQGADIVVKMDGDGQMRGEFMKQLVVPIVQGIADYAKGNRFLHTSQLKLMPKSRLAGNVILTFLTKVASGYWHVFDPQNGYLAIHSDFLRGMDLKRLSTRRYFFENEMLIQLNIESARVLDVPMPAIYEGATSSLRISRVLMYFPRYLLSGFLTRLFQRYVLRDFSAVVPLYLLGSGLFIWGVVFGFLTWQRSWTVGVAATTGTVMLSVLPLILGFQMLLQGLLLEVMQSPRATKVPRTNSGSTGSDL